MSIARATNVGTSGRIQRAAALVTSGIDGSGAGLVARRLRFGGPESTGAGKLSVSGAAGGCGQQGRPAGRLGFGGDRQVDVVVGIAPVDRLHRRSRLRRALERLGHPTAVVGAVDLGLRLDCEPSRGELVFGPQRFGGRAHLGALDGDRGVGLDFGAFPLCVGGCPPILRGLTAPQPKEQGQQVLQHAERR